MLLNVTLVYILHMWPWQNLATCLFEAGLCTCLSIFSCNCVHQDLFVVVCGYVHACSRYLCWSKPPPVDSCRALCSSCWVGYSLPGTGRHLRTSLRRTRTSHSHSSRGLRGNAHKHTTCCLFPLKSIPLASASNGPINPINTRTYLSGVLNNYNETARIGEYRNESYRIHWPLDSKLL